ncbi:MAG: hypothetical protein AAGI30_01285 [Planctomycetota bacterium]
MIRQVPTQIVAACFALSGFALAVTTALVSSVDSSAAMERALVAMLVCWVIGGLVARAASVAIREHIEEYRAERDGDIDEVMDAEVLNDTITVEAT